MYENKELEWNKRDEIYRGTIPIGGSYEAAKGIFEMLEDECLIDMTSPQTEEPFMQMVSLRATHSGRYNGGTYKPGNIVFNIKESVISSAKLAASLGISIGAVTASQPILTILTIIMTVLSVAELGKIELKDNAALILAVLWENKGQYTLQIEEDKGYKLVNQKLSENNRDGLSLLQYKDLLEDLEKLKSIEVKDGEIHLKEKIHILY